ncbi:TauD/TfdA family dioxygenase [Kitasatospora sp. HPMI-4]|uniref:TauD/TfdA family dioxygenase n=1 Tax=Kitasatospora sp. HPMI-4 TaxID=3448443 RepID=UPI003F1D9390
MTTPPSSGVRAMRRRVAVTAQQDLVSVTDSPHSILSIVRPTAPSVDLEHWMRSNRTRVEDLLRDRGAVLFRGFQVSGPEEFQNVVKAWSPQLLNYTYGSTPRSRSSAAGVYTSTEYPADQTIPQHNEMAYARIWPEHLWFYCHQASPEGGVTPLADSHLVAQRLDRALLDSFAERGVCYVRHYGTGFDLTWQQAFETDSRAEVEELCRAQGIEYTWYGEDRLKTSQVCQAVIEHPSNGKELWFNQAHLFHTSALAPEVRDELRGGGAEVPREVYFGDGEPIADAVLEEVRAAFVAETIREPWQDGDVMVIDNMSVSHGRDPYEGPRRVLVAMTDERSGHTGELR